MAKVTMPQLGESVAEGTIGKWLKHPGDSVARDEPLLEVITDKVNAEVPSPFEGVLRKILVEEGKTVPYNAEIAEIEEVAGAAAAPRGAGTAAAKAAAPGTFSPGPRPRPPRRRRLPEPLPGPRPRPPRRRRLPEPLPGPRPRPLPAAAARPAPLPAFPAAPALVPVMQAEADGPTGDPNARMTPAVRRMLREHGLTPAQIVGTGHAGRITRDDVMTLPGRGGARSASGLERRGAWSCHCGRPGRRFTVRPSGTRGRRPESRAGPGTVRSFRPRRFVVVRRDLGGRPGRGARSRTTRCGAASPRR